MAAYDRHNRAAPPLLNNVRRRVFCSAHCVCAHCLRHCFPRCPYRCHGLKVDAGSGGALRDRAPQPRRLHHAQSHLDAWAGRRLQAAAAHPLCQASSAQNLPCSIAACADTRQRALWLEWMLLLAFSSRTSCPTRYSTSSGARRNSSPAIDSRVIRGCSGSGAISTRARDRIRAKRALLASAARSRVVRQRVVKLAFEASNHHRFGNQFRFHASRIRAITNHARCRTRT